MNKVLTIVAVMSLLIACTSKFYRVTIDVNNPQFKKYTLDSSFELYLRTVCTKEAANGTDLPSRCNSKSTDTIEASYLFLSRSMQKVLVINNIPNRNQRLYTKTQFNRNLNRTNELDVVQVNIWGFSQFRFGTLVGDDVVFRTTDKRPQEHVWHLIFEGDSIKVKSVGVQFCNGEDYSWTDSSLFLAPLYKKVKYEMTFEQPRRLIRMLATDTTAISPRTGILLNEIPTENKARRIQTYFALDSMLTGQWGHRFNAIRFNSTRTYSFEWKPGDCIGRQD